MGTETQRKRQRRDTTSTTERTSVGESTTTRSDPKKQKKRNPFLPTKNSATSSASTTLLLDSILRFTHRPKKKKEGDGDTNVNESMYPEVEQQQRDTKNRRGADFDRILAYLQPQGKDVAAADDDDDDDDGTISRYDVARMVLTWSLQQALRTQSSLEDILRGLDAVLAMMVQQSPDADTAAVGITTGSSDDQQEQEQQQSLRRLLEHSFTPRILSVLVDRIIRATATPVPLIERVYPQLLTFYHPTMEVACRQVFLRLYESSDDTNPKQQTALQHATRAWIAQDVSRRGNPKTNFTLLATTPALLFALAEEDDDKEEDGATCSSSRSVLTKLLFAWRYHGDGYSKVLLQNDTEKNNSKKQPPMQAQLLSTVAACLKDKDDCIPMLHLLPTLLEGFCHHTSIASTPSGSTRKQRGGAANSKKPASTLDTTVAGTLQLRLFHRWAQAVLHMTRPNNTNNDASTDHDAILHRTTCLAQLLQKIWETMSARQHPDLRTLPVLSDATAFLLSSIAPDERNATPTMMAAANTALCCLVRLHHELLNDAGWIQALQALLNSATSSSNTSIELLDLCIDMFARLRQQGRCIEILVQVGQQQLPAFLSGVVWISMIATAPLAERTAMVQVVRQHPWIAPHVLPFVTIDTPVAAQAVWQVMTADDGSSLDATTAAFWDLQARCAFWLGCNLPMKEDGGEQTQGIDDALVRDCYRLRAWHGRMQQEEFHALAEDRPVDEQLRSRGVALVEGMTSSSPTTTRWTQLLPHLEFWLPLASDATVDRFLQWLLRSAVLEEEKSISLNLLQDASFYSHDCIADRLHRVGVSLIANEIFEGVQRATGKVLDGPMTVEQRINHLVNMANGTSGIAHLPIAASFENAIQHVDSLNALPFFLGDDETEWEVIMWLFKVDGFAQSLLTAINVPSQMERNVLTLMAGLRKFIGGHLLLFNSDCFATSLQDRLPDQFAPALIRQTVETLQSVGHDIDGLEAVATATADIVRLLLLSDSPRGQKGAGLVTPDKSCTATIKDLSGIYSKSEARVDKKVAISIMVRAILDGLQCSQWPKRSGTWDDKTKACACEFIQALSPLTLPTGTPDAIDPVCSMVRYHVMVLQAWKADSISVKGTTKSNSKLAELVDLCINLQDEIEPWCYFAALLAETSPSWELAVVVAQVSAALHKDQSSSSAAAALLSDACYCRMIECFSDDELCKTVEKVLQQSNNRGTEPSVRLVRLTLQYTKVDSQTQRDQPPAAAYASMGMDILSTALKYLVKDEQAHGTGTCNVVETAKLVGELIKRRDVHTFSEFELSVILSRIHEILRSSEESSSNSTFAALAALYTLLFQRYTKPMYACVANVMSVLQAFLVDAMKDQGTTVREKKAQHVIRMCEGLVGHRDVFKKHVVGLCVTFLSQGDAMEDLRHDPLLPAMFYLLDTMTKYEVDQLHAFLHERSRTSLKTIQNMYEKSHVFRGQ